MAPDSPGDPGMSVLREVWGLGGLWVSVTELPKGEALPNPGARLYSRSINLTHVEERSGI